MTNLVVSFVLLACSVAMLFKATKFLWDRLCAHNIVKYLPLFALCWLEGGLAWVIQGICVSVVVMWNHS